MAALSCSGKVVKYILFVLNLLFWVSGTVLLGIGIWILVLKDNANHYLNVVGVNYELAMGAAITLVIVGSLVFIVGGLGCCGACTENAKCLTAFSVIVSILLVLQVVAVILAITLHNQIVNELSGLMIKSLDDYDKDNTTAIRALTESWNFMQMEMSCCGVKEPVDWNTTTWKTKARGANVPDSCCVGNKSQDYLHPYPKDRQACNADAYINKSSQFVYTTGCLSYMDSWFLDRVVVLIAGTVAVLIVQLFIVIMACVLKSNIKNAYEYV